MTDDGQPVNFYPYFSAVRSSGQNGDSRGESGCMLGFGSTLPGTTNDFGGINGYGSLLFSVYLRNGFNGATRTITNNFRQVFANNPCPASGSGDEASKPCRHQNGGGRADATAATPRCAQRSSSDQTKR